MKKYQFILKMIKRDIPRTSIPITLAFKDDQNKGVIAAGKRQVTIMKMHVDDNLIADIMPFIDYVIVVSVDSILQVLENREPSLRKTSLSEEKFVKQPYRAYGIN